MLALLAGFAALAVAPPVPREIPRERVPSVVIAGTRPFSEPESRAVRRLILRLRPRVTIWFHQPWGQVLAPCHGAAALQRRYARLSGLPVKRCRGSELPGTATRWQMHALPASRAFVVELGTGRLSAAAMRRHARAVRAVAG